MYFHQFYLGCLAQASYMIGSDGEAAVVDPRRDVEEYLEEARARGLTIRHVIETHLHADFVSGHKELAERTGARIYFGARAGVKFPHVPVHDGDSLAMGRVTLRFLETPGHTPESISILVYDREEGSGEIPEAVLTGDTLFIGDVGRPDLLGAKISPNELAGQLYDSLHEKLLTLPDSVKVFPAHGAGSLCGRNISSETSSTIGEQRRYNYALRPMPREEFVALVTTDLPEAPAYFARDVQLNREGPGALEELPAPPPLSPEGVEALRQSGAIVVDTRPPAEFGAGHVPGAMNLGQSGQLASWAGALLSPKDPLVLVAEDPERVAESRTRLTRVGLENVAGYLDGGIRAWDESGRPLVRTEQIDVDELRARLDEDRALQLVDVRRPAEWHAGHIGRAVHMPLHRLAELARSLDRERPVAVVCRSGYRSSIATSLLERMGFRKTTNVIGGMDAWTGAQFETETEEFQKGTAG
jgi:glyoxylase-like metal-dependent hydrolase (beta-lactamase superfamily II)/3-mercaptopyruvate sulfurtransferase SseA